MNGEILKQILPIIEQTKEGIAKGIEIAQQQTPDLINQLLRWQFAKHLFWVILGFSMFLICLILIKIIIKISEKEDFDFAEPSSSFIVAFIWVIIIGLGTLLSLISYPYNVLTLIQIKIAPKIYLLEYISDLLK